MYSIVEVLKKHDYEMYSKYIKDVSHLMIIKATMILIEIGVLEIRKWRGAVSCLDTLTSTCLYKVNVDTHVLQTHMYGLNWT
jgi:hypothetical protein